MGPLLTFLADKESLHDSFLQTLEAELQSKRKVVSSIKALLEVLPVASVFISPERKSALRWSKRNYYQEFGGGLCWVPYITGELFFPLGY